MSFAVRKPRAVEEDQLQAAVWYDEQQPGLGDEFLDAGIAHRKMVLDL